MRIPSRVVRAALAVAALGFAGGLLEGLLIAFRHGYYFHTVRSLITFLLVPGAFYAAAGLALGALIAWLLTVIRRGRSPGPLVCGAAGFVVVALIAASVLEDAELPVGRTIAWGAAALVAALLAGFAVWVAAHRRGALRAGALVAALSLVAAAAAGVWLFGPGGSGSTPVRAELSDRSRSVVLLTIDTLRADHVGCYAGEDEDSLTPNIDRLAHDGRRFENAVTPIVVTDPSHASMLTGLYPAEHGVIRNAVPLEPDVTTVAEVFRAAGYRTGAAVSVEHMNAQRSGLSQGFDVYYDRGYHDRFRYHAGWKMMPRPRKNRMFAHERSAVEANECALRFLGTVDDGPFFLWVHYFEPHTPYVGSDGDLFGEDDRAALEGAAARGEAADLAARAAALYRDEVRRADAAFGELLAALEARGLLSELAVVIVSDHGEHMAEERLEPSLWFGHSDVYDEACRVPLIVGVPDERDPEVISEQVCTKDIAVRLLRTARVSTDWAPYVNRAERPRPVVVEPNPHMPVEGTALRAGRWKLIARPGARLELYDLAADPGETSNIVDAHRPLADSLGAEMARIVQGWGPPETPDEPDAATREMLRSLGYLE